MTAQAIVAKPSFKPTEEQEAVIDAAKQPESVMVNARAGCSKTTSLQLAAPQIKVPALALAFNKKIAKELEPRLPGNFSVKTLNGLGHGAWARSMPGITRLELDDKKLGKLVSKIARERKMDLSTEQWDQVRRLASRAMMLGLVPGNEGGFLLEDTPEAWADIAEDLWISADDAEYLVGLAKMVVQADIELARQGVISFDDQIYCSVCLGGSFPKYPVVFVDEAQDLSPLNHRMLELCSRADSKILAVGDPAQAIYAFRGAASDSMTRIRRLRPNWIDRPLNTTFRCPKSIVARQQHHVPGFKAWHTNAEGRFARLNGKSDGEAVLKLGGWDWSDVTELLPTPDGQIAVLCRNNAPLLGLAFKLLRQRVGVVMLGRDIGKNLIALSKKILPDSSTLAAACAALINDWQEHEASLARANGHEEKVSGIYDRAECLQAVLAGAQCRDAGQLRVMLEQLFARDQGLVTLSTIHRAKGLEWDLVMNLDPWRIPSKFAKKAADAGNAETLVQEYNLLYVAETRTRHTLLNANLEDFNG